MDSQRVLSDREQRTFVAIASAALLGVFLATGLTLLLWYDAALRAFAHLGGPAYLLGYVGYVVAGGVAIALVAWMTVVYYRFVGARDVAALRGRTARVLAVQVVVLACSYVGAQMLGMPAGA